MNPPAVRPLTEAAAYLGLWASLALAITCNAFLDIRYGSFAVEVIFWSGVFAWTLFVGWRQHGQANANGRAWQRGVLIVGGLLSVLVFIRLWGFPRAGLYLLAVLQAAVNCVLTTRRQLHFSLLVSVVMVMFAAVHYLADWTLLFYLVPYLAAAVFTLVAEQVGARRHELAARGVAPPPVGGQLAAMVAATGSILLLAGLLYAVTPQPNPGLMTWSLGQPTSQGHVTGGAGEGSGAGGSGDSPGGAGGGGMNREGAAGGWPTPEDMRNAARRPGMPHWQSAAILQIANASEWTQVSFAPLVEALKAAWEALRAWMEKHRLAVLAIAFTLLALALAALGWLLWRETPVGLWLHSRADYLRLGLLGRHPAGAAGLAAYQRAAERLYALADLERPSSASLREHLVTLRRFRDDLAPEAAALLALYEAARYGPPAPAAVDPKKLERMRELYCALYRRIDPLRALRG